MTDEQRVAHTMMLTRTYEAVTASRRVIAQLRRATLVEPGALAMQAAGADAPAGRGEVGAALSGVRMSSPAHDPGA